MGHEKFVEEDSLVPVRLSHSAIGWRQSVGGEAFGQSSSKSMHVACRSVDGQMNLMGQDCGMPGDVHSLRNHLWILK